MVILITGANGYLGKELTRYFAERGHQIIALSRVNSFIHPNVTFFSFELGKPLDARIPRIDIAIHCAYDLSLISKEKINQINVSGSLQLFSELKEKGNPRVIHISSISAFDGCQTVYGQAKLAIEKASENDQVLSIRPGLIYGGENRGLIGKLTKLARKLSIIPMIGTGNYPQYVSSLEWLIQIIEKIIQSELPWSKAPITLSSQSPITLKALIRELGSPHKRWFIPIYWRIPWLGLTLLEKLKMRLPFKSDSIKSLVYPNTGPNFEYLKQNGIKTDPPNMKHFE